jgi:hypothetical protein
VSTKKRGRARTGSPPRLATEAFAASGPYLPIECLALPDDQLAFQFWHVWIAFQAKLRGIPEDQLTPDVCESLRATTADIDGDIEAVAGIEKALRILARGDDPARAGSLIRQHIGRQAVHLAALDEAVAGHRRQRAYAKKPRTDGLQEFIFELLREAPKLTFAELLARLRSVESQGIIDTVNDDDKLIEWHDKKEPAGTVSFNALGSRLSRARKAVLR